MSITKSGCIFAVAALVVAAAGCYDEPVSAEATVSAEKRIYLKNTDLGRLTVEAVYEKGLIYDSHWTNLSSRIDLQNFNDRVLKSVDYLNLDYNALTNVDDVAKFPALKWLRLNSNRLSSLPDLSKLTELRKIYLRGNHFVSVPEMLKGIPSLTDIDLSGNSRIAEIPEWLAKKQGLEHLSFSGTAITRLPEDISAWKSLKTLQLGNLTLSRKEMDRIRAELPDTAVVF